MVIAIPESESQEFIAAMNALSAALKEHAAALNKHAVAEEYLAEQSEEHAPGLITALEKLAEPEKEEPDGNENGTYFIPEDKRG
jgi:hypothetical protein